MSHCRDCKHYMVPFDQFPCNGCVNGVRWESRTGKRSETPAPETPAPLPPGAVRGNGGELLYRARNRWNDVEYVRFLDYGEREPGGPRVVSLTALTLKAKLHAELEATAGAERKLELEMLLDALSCLRRSDF